MTEHIKKSLGPVPLATTTPDGAPQPQTRRFRLTIDIQSDRVRDLEDVLDSSITAAFEQWLASKRVEYEAEFEDPTGARHPAPNLDHSGVAFGTDWRVTITDDTGVVERAHQAEEAARRRPTAHRVAAL